MEFDYDAGVVYGAGDGAAGDPRLREENEDLRKELRRLREECKRLKEVGGQDITVQCNRAVIIR